MVAMETWPSILIIATRYMSVKFVSLIYFKLKQRNRSEDPYYDKWVLMDMGRPENPSEQNSVVQP